MSFVVDCSYLLASLFPDEIEEHSAEILEALNVDGAVIPALWWHEVANGLVIAVRRKRITDSQRYRFINVIRSMALETDIEGFALYWAEVMELAMTYDLTTYDATYLELAKRRNLPLATRDKALKKAAKKCGIKLYEL